MRRLKKSIFQQLSAGIVVVLAVIRWCNPGIVDSSVSQVKDVAPKTCLETQEETIQAEVPSLPVSNVKATVATVSKDGFKKHRIYGVTNFQTCFPDVQDVQIVPARKWGVRPVRNREEAEKRKSELVYVGADPYFHIDPTMSRSIPYLVPRASHLLRMIGRNFLDSLYVKGVPFHKVIVSSILRTEEDVARLRQYNGNATEQSCHRFGTTFDIPYNRYYTVSPPDGPRRRTVQNDTLKWVLSEVLRDLRKDNQCYVKYEVKQGCFHITVR